MRSQLTKTFRWVWGFVVLALFGIVSVYAIQRLMIMPGFVKLERDEVEKDMTRCRESLTREVFHLDQICGDWASWDDTYQFVHDQNEGFIKSNIDWATLESNSGLNLIMFCGVDGRLIWGEAFSSASGGKIGIGEFAAEIPGENRYLVAHADKDSKLTGVLQTRRGPLLISSRPVLKTDGQGPIAAVLLMGRFLDDRLLASFAEQTKVSFHAKDLHAALPTAEEFQTLSRLEHQPCVIIPNGKDELYGYGVVTDLKGAPALLLKASFPRAIMKQGQATARLASGVASVTLTLSLLLIALGFAAQLIESNRHAARIEKQVDERTAELREARQFLEAAVAQSPCGILIADAPDVTIRLANEAALGIRGGDPAKLMGISMAQHAVNWQTYFKDGTPCPHDRLPLSRAVLHGEVTRDSELIIRDEDGVDHWVNANAAPIRNVDGKIIAGIVIFRDITKRKLAEDELQKTQRLRSIGTLAGGIAHDFNNILMALYGNISLAKAEISAGHPGYKPLDDVEKSMSRAVRLTRQLLTFARGGEPIKQDVSIGTLVEDVVQFDLSGSSVVAVIKQEKDLWRAVADKGQVQQVISNLTVNAREAMPSGGHLHVTLENADFSEGGPPGVQRGKYVKITMRDEGAGIEQKHLDRIFEPYFSTKETGSGLGLATTYSIVNKHGGHISVVSAVGSGTTFTLLLPASEVVPQTASAPAGAAPNHVALNARILLLDDEEMIRYLVAKMLQNSGYSVETAAEGRQAIAMYKQALEAGKPFDVVLMDLTIPGGLGGKDAVLALLELHPEAKAIVSSGYAEDPVMAHYADYGFKGVVAKPYTQSELLDVVGRVLRS